MKIPAVNRFFRSFAPIFRPPFEGLWLVALLYVAWSFLVYPDSPILRGNLPDADDYMYLTQLSDWLKGQGWFDNIQHRLDPPMGVPIHFSRLAQLPMAGIVLVLERLGLGLRGAATVMALIWPLALLGFFFAAMRWTAQALMPKEWTGVTAYVALFAAGMLFFFAPGHVDHHGLIILLVTLPLGCALRMMRDDAKMRWGFYTGTLLALALTVALEALPWVLVTSTFVGLYGVVRGGKAARNGLVYGLALYLGSIVGLLLTRPCAGLLTIDALSYSVVYVFLTGGIAVALAGVALAADMKIWARLGLGGGLAFLTGTWFLRSFPDLIGGPYGAMDPLLAQLMLGEIAETKPLLGAVNWMDFPAHAGSSLLALPVGFWFLTRAKDDERWRWGLVMALLTAAFALAAFYQRRFVGVMDAFAVLPLAVMLQRGWMAAARMDGRLKVYAEIGLLLLAGPLPLVLMPAMLDGRSLNKGVLLFPALTTGNPCDMYALENVLRDPAAYGERPRVIINAMSSGSELLFRTPHEVLSAPYHMDVQGNLDATRFFSTTDPAEAEAIARRRSADLVVACRAVPDIYLRVPKATQAKAFSPPFVALLMANLAPRWLKRVRFKGLDNYAVFEVLPPDHPADEPRRK